MDIYIYLEQSYGENNMQKQQTTAIEEQTPGLKYDSEKQEWYAMPLEVVKLLADVFAAGEKKYKTFNCLKSFEDSDRRFYNATLRHISECQIDPLAKDTETGCYHGAQAAWNILMRTYHADKKARK